MKPSSFNSWTILVFALMIVSCGQTTNYRIDGSKNIVTAVHPVDTSLIAVIPFDKSINLLG